LKTYEGKETPVDLALQLGEVILGVFCVCQDATRWDGGVWVLYLRILEYFLDVEAASADLVLIVPRSDG
jgi:hypothetical protein